MSRGLGDVYKRQDHAAWVDIAIKSSHKAFAEKVPGGDKLMEMALAVK